MASRRNTDWRSIGILAMGLLSVLVAPDSRGAAHRNVLPHRHGADASTPARIPTRGWKEIAKRVVRAFSTDRLLANAAGVTFYSILAIFPAMAALVSLYGLFFDPASVEEQVKTLSGIIPEGGMQIISEELHSLASSGSGSLSFGLIFGLLVALWSANSGVKALFDALNVAYEVPERRSFVQLNLLGLAFTLGGLVFILLGLGAVVVVPAVLSLVGLGGFLDVLLNLARWPLLLVAIALFLAIIYRYGPSRIPPRWRWVTPGGAFAAITLVILSILFSWYVANFGSYNKTYGSLGAAIGFMTWIWLSTTIILVGGEINRETEAQAPTERGSHGLANANRAGG